MKLHLDTVGGVAYFAGTNRGNAQDALSLYLSNVHAANLGVRFDLASRASIYAGYAITRDPGDGRAAPAATPAVLGAVQTFPLSYQSPLARLSIRISPKLRWNAAWQYYGYREDFGLLTYYQNFHAHTGYTSLTWAF